MTMRTRGRGQGDDKSGRIARSDVAAICVEAIGSAAAFDTTFECYYAETAKGLDDVMASIAKARRCSMRSRDLTAACACSGGVGAMRRLARG